MYLSLIRAIVAYGRMVFETVSHRESVCGTLPPYRDMVGYSGRSHFRPGAGEDLRALVHAWKADALLGKLVNRDELSIAANGLSSYLDVRARVFWKVNRP